MDYCTLFPDGWWAHCCAAHDAAYAAQAARSVADMDLLRCVAASATSSPALAVVSAVVGVAMMATDLAGRRTAVPFGPLLALGTIVAIFVGQHFVDLVLAR